MKAKILKHSLLIVILGVTLFSCKKGEHDISTNSTEVVSPNQLQIENINFDEIGNLHNQFLEKMYDDLDQNNFEYNENNLEIVVNNIISEESQNMLNTPFQNNYSFENIEKKYQENYNEVKNNISQNAIVILDDIIAKSQLDVITSLSSFTSIIESIEETQINSLPNESDKITLLITTAIMKKSAEFWLPVNKGGNGKGAEIIDQQPSATSTKGYVAADGLGGAGASLGAAVVAAVATGPVGWGFLIGIAISAACSSASYGILSNWL